MKNKPFHITNAVFNGNYPFLDDKYLFDLNEKINRNSSEFAKIFYERLLIKYDLKNNYFKLFNYSFQKTLSFYIDKYIRFQKFKDYFFKNYIYNHKSGIRYITSPDELDKLSKDHEFIQKNFIFICKFYNKKLKLISNRKKQILEKKLNNNYLFDIRNKNSFEFLYKRFVSKFFENYSPLQCLISSDHLANDFNSFRINNFFFNVLNNNTFKNLEKKINAKINRSNRNFVFDYDQIKPIDLYQVLNIKIPNEDIFIKSFLKFCQYYFPIHTFESLIKLDEFIKNYLPNTKKNIFLSTHNGGYSLFLKNFIARTKGYKIIRSQHGGYYGYINYHPEADIEYKDCDYFITWGWAKKINKIDYPKFVDLPSPWLSERYTYFTNNLDKKNFTEKKRVLFMPSMIKLFPVFNQMYGTTRYETALSQCKSIFNIIKLFSNYKINVDIKFYDEISLNYFKSNFDLELDNIKYKYFKLIDNFDKGLSPKLVSKYDFILFDHPGTGYLECLAYKIPTIIVWDKSFSKENQSSKNEFKKLKRLNLLYEKLDQLKPILKNYSHFLRKINNPKINDFRSKYINIDIQWSKKWLSFLNNI